MEELHCEKKKNLKNVNLFLTFFQTPTLDLQQFPLVLSKNNLRLGFSFRRDVLYLLQPLLQPVSFIRSPHAFGPDTKSEKIRFHS